MGLRMAAVLGVLAVALAGRPGVAGPVLPETALFGDPAGAVRAPDFPTDLAWLNTDRPLTLRELRGKVVLLDFWTYCCINCMHVLPELNTLEHRFPDELVVIGVHSGKFAAEGETANIKQAILRYGVEHPVLNDAGFRVWDAYAVRAWPTLVLIDPEGHVVGTKPGEANADQLEPAIRALITTAEARGTLRRGPVPRSLERDRMPSTVLSYPGKVLADAAGGRLFIADSSHHRYLICGLDGEVREVIGAGTPGFDDGAFAQATFRQPQGMALVGERLYLADTGNHALRVADLQARTVTTLVGTGQKPERYNLPGRGRFASLHSPWDVLSFGGALYVANAGSHQLWRVDPATGDAAPFAGSGREDIHDGPALVATRGGPDPNASAALAQPSGLTTDGRQLYWADSETSSLRRFDPATGRVTTLIGQGLFVFGDADGDRRTARLQHPLGVDWVDGRLYVADTYNNRIRVYDPATQRLTTLAGTGKAGAMDGPGDRATFDEPGGLTHAGGKLYVADTDNQTIRVVDLATRQVSTLALAHVERAAPPMGGRRGTLVELPAATVKPGTGHLILSLEPAPGDHLNPGAPLTITVAGEPAGVVTVADPRLRLHGATPPVILPATFAVGRTTLSVEVDAYVCAVDGQGGCRYQPVTLRVPVTVSADARESELTLPYRLRP